MVPRAMESGIEPLVLFARRLKGYLQGILNQSWSRKP